MSAWRRPEREKKLCFLFFLFTQQRARTAESQRRRADGEGPEGTKKQENQLLALPWPSFFFSFASPAPPPPTPTQSPASSKRCADHSAAEPSGEGGKEFQTPSIASQIESLTINGNGVDHRRSGSEWAYQE